MLTDPARRGKRRDSIRPGSADEQFAVDQRVPAHPAIGITEETIPMYEQSQLGTYVVLAFYAIAGVLAVIGGIMAVRARRKQKREHGEAR
jgi:hypothetical protein